MTARFTTNDGSHGGEFRSSDWSLILTVALIWGSSFLWIAIGLDSLHPGVVAAGRVMSGGAALWLLPASRRHVPREAWPGIAAVGVLGNAAPALFFALAQQRVESSVAGMLNAVSPMIILAIAAVMTRRAPVALQVGGLVIGLTGALLMAIPNVIGAEAQPLGVFFVLCAVTGYALSNNIIPPLQQAYGGAAVIARALIVASIVLAPIGLVGLGDSSFTWPSVTAVLILGIVGTGIARALFATAIGRVGPTRSSIVAYLVPVVATVLGVAVRNESIHPLEAAGTMLVLGGAFVISRAVARVGASS